MAASDRCGIELVRRDVSRNTLHDQVRVRGEAGACSYRMARDGGLRNGFVLSRPTNGSARLRSERETLVIEYTPQPGFRGRDPFVVRLTSFDPSYPSASDVLVDMTVDAYVTE